MATGIAQGPIQELEEVDELHHALAAVALPMHFAGACLESREEVHGARPLVFVFDLGRTTGQRWTGRGHARAGLDGGLLVHAQNDLVRAKRPGVEIAEVLGSGDEFRVARGALVQPDVRSPGLEAMVREDPLHRLGGDRFYQPLTLQLPGEFRAVP
jgi:hypothetical protein